MEFTSQALFIPGGPGLNSQPERAALGPALRQRGVDVAFWDEPSRLRPAGAPFEAPRAFRAACRSASEALDREFGRRGRKIHLVAHSFGAQVALRIAAEAPEQVAGVTWIAPAADPRLSLRNVLRVAAEELRRAPGPVPAAEMEILSAATRELLDPAMRKGLEMALGIPAVVGRYFAEPAALQGWAAAISEPAYGVDLESMWAVLEDLRSQPAPAALPAGIATQALFGALDPFCPGTEQEPLIRALCWVGETRVIPGASHFVQLDRVAETAERIAAFAAKA